MVSSEEDDLLYSLSQGGPGEMSEDEGTYAFRRNLNCQYKKPIHSGVGAWSRVSRARNTCPSYRCKFTLGSVRDTERSFVRRRVGRGGRIVIDRLSTDVDDVWSKLDYTIFDSWKAQKEAEQPIVVKLEDVEGRGEGVCNGEGSEVTVLKSDNEIVSNSVSPLRDDFVDWCEQDMEDYEDIVPQNVREMLRKGDFTRESLSCYRPKSPAEMPHSPSPVPELLEDRDVHLEIQAIEDRSLTCDFLLSDNIFYPTPFTLDDLISSSDLNLDSDFTTNLHDDATSDTQPEVSVGCSQFTVADASGSQKSDSSPSKALQSSTRTSRRASIERMESENIADTSNDSDDVPLVAYQIESQAAAAAAAAAAAGASTSATGVSEAQGIVLGLSTPSRSVLNGSNDNKNGEVFSMIFF